MYQWLLLIKKQKLWSTQSIRLIMWPIILLILLTHLDRERVLVKILSQVIQGNQNLLLLIISLCYFLLLMEAGEARLQVQVLI